MKNIFSIWIFFFAVFISPIKSAETYRIDHLEPPFWWTGMASNKLQIMVHGNNIAELSPSINYPYIEIKKIHRVENANYLFIDLELSPQMKPGEFEITFSINDQTYLTYQYTLLKREPGSAERLGFNPADVIYLITPDRFANSDLNNDSSPALKETHNRAFKGGRHGGDLQGIIDHLDYIADMGFTQIWLNPVLQNDQPSYSYHGYSTTDYYQIDGRFGTNTLYKKLSEQAKQKGIGIIKDVILNHIGSEHWWMKDLPTRDWINNEGSYTQTSHRRETIHDPHSAITDKKYFADGWFVPTMPDLNQRNPFLATYIMQNSIWWIEYAGLSGFRVDTYSYSDKTFLSQWTDRLVTEYPNINFVGEEWTHNVALVAYWQKDSPRYDDYVSKLPSLMDFPLQKSVINGLLNEENWATGLREIYQVISSDFLYGNPNNLVIFADNHDMNRVFTQLNKDYELFKMAMIHLFTTRGIPQIYYGTEILMTNPEKGDHGIIRTDFPGGWPNDKVNGFTGNGLKPKQKKAQQFIRELLQWRKTSTAVTKGNLIHYTPENGFYIYFRQFENELIMVIMNKNKKQTTLDTNRFEEVLSGKNTGKDVLNNELYDLSIPIKIPKKSAVILNVY